MVIKDKLTLIIRSGQDVLLDEHAIIVGVPITPKIRDKFGMGYMITHQRTKYRYAKSQHYFMMEIAKKKKKRGGFDYELTAIVNVDRKFIYEIINID